MSKETKNPIESPVKEVIDQMKADPQSFIPTLQEINQVIQRREMADKKLKRLRIKVI